MRDAEWFLIQSCFVTPTLYEWWEVWCYGVVDGCYIGGFQAGFISCFVQPWFLPGTLFKFTFVRNKCVCLPLIFCSRSAIELKCRRELLQEMTANHNAENKTMLGLCFLFCFLSYSFFHPTFFFFCLFFLLYPPPPWVSKVKLYLSIPFCSTLTWHFPAKIVDHITLFMHWSYAF